MSKNPPSDKELKEFLDFHEDPKNKDYINIEVVLEKMHADLQSGGKKKGGGKKKKWCRGCGLMVHFAEFKIIIYFNLNAFLLLSTFI